MRKSTLRRVEWLKLYDAVREQKTQFANWKEALSYFSSVCQKTVTKDNVLRACEDVEIDVKRLVAFTESANGSPFAKLKLLGEQVVELQARLKEFEHRVTYLESKEIFK